MRALEGKKSSATTAVQRHELALQRLDAKNEVIAQIIDGRLGLVEAAQQFRELNHASTTAASVAVSDEELCRSLIGWVCLALSERPERADALSDQLESELAAHIGRQG